MQDLTTKKQTRISKSGAASHPDIYGDKIVWSDMRLGRGDTDVYMYDISSKKETRIATGRSSPSIYSNKTVWDSYSYGKSDVFLYDISTKKETQITSNGHAENPEIYGNRIVWQDYRNGNWDIYMYDLSTKKETQITVNSSDQVNPVIYGNSIAWQDSRNGIRNWDIYLYDLKTRQQIHTTNISNQIAPAIYGNKVVWTDYRNGNSDIYMGTISYLPVAAFSASHTSGKKPLTVKFTDKSTDAYYWSWNFGDKTTSKDQNPEHKYTKAGKYTVTLTVKNAAGTNTAKKTNYIIVG